MTPSLAVATIRTAELDAYRAFGPALPLSIDDQIEDIQDRLQRLYGKAETGEQFAEIAFIEAKELVPLLRQTSPADPLRKAADSLSTATKFRPAQVAWACGHDWFESATADGALIVVDSFTYEGRSYHEHVVWGGTFAELRDWAGY